MDVVRSVRAQEQDRAGDVGRLRPAAGRDPVEDCLAARGVLAQVIGVGRGNVPRCDGVDVDATGSPLVGEGLGEPGHGRLGGRVAGDVDPALEAEQRGGVDDLAAASLEHRATHLTGQDEGRTHVDVHDVVEVLVAVLGHRGAPDGAAVVDQDVDPATREVLS